jgi:H+/Cl- antiporter ClcA
MDLPIPSDNLFSELSLLFMCCVVIGFYSIFLISILTASDTSNHRKRQHLLILVVLAGVMLAGWLQHTQTLVLSACRG